jgi:transcription initiation factor TFIIIB Brf1 subunit/transcription initiation factor TFIIB
LFSCVLAALLIASKYEEVYPPALRDLVHVSASAYSRKEILHMETLVLITLNHKVTVATSHSFLVYFLQAVNADTRATHLALYHAERMLQEYGMLKYLPSVVAAAAVYAAMKTLERDDWVRAH